jgi:hypothetical protein
MQLKAIILCAAVAAALNVNLSAAEQPGVPRGWTLAPSTGGSFEVGYDGKEGATYLKSVGDPGQALAALQQSVDPKAFQGKRLMLTAEIKASEHAIGGELYIRAKSQSGTSSGASWDAQTDWTTVKVQLLRGMEQPLDSLDFGVVLQGKGEVWMRNLRLETLSDAVVIKADNMPLHESFAVPPAQAKPVNLELRP